jgi:hypothetical protein
MDLSVSLVHRAFSDARTRLTKYLGADDAEVVFDQACLLARLHRWPETSEELMAVAVMLFEQHPENGIIAATGRGMKVSALLLGAREP